MDGASAVGRGLVAPAFIVVMMSAGVALAELPMPPQTGCGVDGDVSACPSEMREGDGTVRGGAWSYLNFVPDYYTKVKASEVGLGSGSHSTTAWQTTTGRFDVPIAILDCGIRWRDTDLNNKIWLNTGELPLPQNAAGQPCANGDCDGNGLWTVSDYAQDTRVSIAAGRDEADTIIDASDLIATFSDGNDNDGNGYIDDIGGWDFMWDDNDPYTNNDFYHGTSVMEEAAAEGNNGGDIGHCPNCSVIPVRISDSFIGEGNKIAAGIVYAVDRGAKVIGMALGSMTNSVMLEEAMRYAWENDVTIVAAAGDELGYHHNFPGANDHAIYVHSIKYWPTIQRENAQTFLGFFGCNNFGARLDLSGASDACATGSTAAISGIAGLVYSRGADIGVELSASEVRQILIHGVDDINVPHSQYDKSPFFPSRRGWDFYFGYGRSNSARAVARVTRGSIPPEVEINGPEWFDYIDPRVMPVLRVSGRIAAPRADGYRYELAWAPGGDPLDDEFSVFGSGANLTSPIEGSLGSLNLSDIPLDALDPTMEVPKTDFDNTFAEKMDNVNAHGLTLRLRVTDTDGNVGEMRRQVFLVEDPDLVESFPVDLGTSGDSSPTLYDLNADGALEIILGTSSGVVHAFQSDGTELPGWPVTVGAFPYADAHADGAAYAQGDVGIGGQGIAGPAAVGDLDDDGVAEVIVATLDGQVFAFGADGSLRPGFPVSRDPLDDSGTNVDVWYDPGMFSGPVLFDLDDDGFLEIIQSSMDRRIYVWREDGSLQDGWPVEVSSPEYEDSRYGRIVSGPGIGDLDGDGDYEIVVGTNEYLNGKQWWGLAYAIHGEGNRRGDPIMRGWPIEIVGAMNGVIMYIGEGVAASPGVVDVDGDGQDEVVFSGVAGTAAIYRGNGKIYQNLRSSIIDNGNTSGANTSFWTIVSNPAIGDINGDGKVDISMVGSGLSYFIALGLSAKTDYAHLLAAWDAQSGEMLRAFPAFMEDISFFLAPAIADISGDGDMEVIAGTSGYILHAVDKAGEEPPGWPKTTGGWMIASPVVGDLDGDGSVEVVAVTREGFLFAWHTQGSSALEPEWSGVRHDPQNTGNYGLPMDRGL